MKAILYGASIADRYRYQSSFRFALAMMIKDNLERSKVMLFYSTTCLIFFY